MTKFSDLELAPDVLKAVVDAGYETPTPIQAGAIPEALKGRDVLGIAQTGTGKTASFTLPMITMLAKGRARARMPRSLVLAPTRELAAQVAENFDVYSKYTKLSKALLIGGVSFKEQERLIDRGVDVLIATPGRLLDHFERGRLLLNGVQVMVVDEADRMLDMGFIPDIERIFKLTPFTRQTLFFSATMAPEITRITQEFLHNPIRIEVARQATTSETITQSLIQLKPSRKDRTFKEKRDLLRNVIEAQAEACTNGIIFCNRKIDVDVLMKSMKKHGYNVGAIHGDLDQSERMRVLGGFRDGSIRFLIASDVAARGLDIPNVSHVFNFDVPSHAEDYVHRIGRTGRAGREGRTIMLATPADGKYLSAIESLIETTIPLMDAPGTAAGANAGEQAAAPAKPARTRRKPASDAPKDAAADAPAAEEKPAKPRRGRKPASDKASTRDAAPAEDQADKANISSEPDNAPQPSEKPARAPRGGKGRSSSGRGRDHRDAVVGMGEHVPAFITRPLRPQP